MPTVLTESIVVAEIPWARRNAIVDRKRFWGRDAAPIGTIAHQALIGVVESTAAVESTMVAGAQRWWGGGGVVANDGAAPSCGSAGARSKMRKAAGVRPGCGRQLTE